MEPINDPEDPRLKRLHLQRLVNRDIDQLLGICELSLMDGCIDQSDAESILAWMDRHRLCLDTWPANVLYDRLRAMLTDNHLDNVEQRELLSLIMSIGGPRDSAGNQTSSLLPVDDPAPLIQFQNRSFCFTGVFDFGSRSECQAAVESRGGIPTKSVTKKLSYLVIGSIGSESWKHTSFGAKIAKAVEYRDAGVPLVIVSEAHWVASLQ